MTGAQPIFVDIEPESFCINPTAVAGAITNRTAAVIAVHLFGHPAPLGYLAQLCSKYSLALAEDAAQALGARSVGRPVGTWGDAASFSFYPTKAIHTLEGGMVATFDASTADRVRMLRNQGMADRLYHYLLVGTTQLDGVSLVAAADPQGDVHQALHHVPVVATVDELLRARPDYAQILKRELLDELVKQIGS